MKEKTKDVTIDSKNYRIRRFDPTTGSFIISKALTTITGGDGPNVPRNPDAPQAPEPHPEDIARGVAINFQIRCEDMAIHAFVQNACLQVCSRLEAKPEVGEIPMPIMAGPGMFAIHEIRDDIMLVMKLELEALVFNFSDFFAGGGLNALTGNPASKE